MDHAEHMRELSEKWQAAAGSDVFANLRKVVRPAPQDRPEDYQDFQRHTPSFNPKVNDAAYWDLIAKAAKNPNDAPDVIEYLMEQEKYTNNPVYPVTYGKDQEPVVTPNWINGEDLEKLIKIKLDLHDLGDKFAAAEAKMDPKAKGLWEQIKTLRNKIDELSDSLAPSKEKEALS
jgi:hypothetical protein